MRRQPEEALVAFAAEVGETGPVAAVGGRTRWCAGGALEAGARLVQAPVGILEHHPEEMTVRVRAGTSVATLESALAGAGQRSCLVERGGTVGGALAVGENHPHQLGRGRVRDAVLQVSYVSADGRIVTGGGPTVKNVSGFDLPRLLVGSLGTLGLMGEVILRTNPVPATSCWVSAADADPFALVGLLHRPGAILWDGTRTWVLLEGHEPDVVAERGRLDAVGTWAPAPGPPELPEHRWSLRPSELRHAAALGAGPFVASVGIGTLWASVAQTRPGPPPALRRLEQRIKAQFDPTGRLNPGRWPGLVGGR